MRPHPRIIDRIIAGLQESRTICVAGHIRPDGDCVGSQLGLTLALRNAGKQVVCWNEDRIPQKYEFLDADGIIQKPMPGLEFDCVVAVDAATFDRLGSVGQYISRRKLFINIDHHESNSRFADLNWVSVREPSTGELVYRLLKIAKWPITRRIADCLFTAVSTDTGSFQYASTQPGTYHVAGELVSRGANLARICNEVYQSYPLSRARLLRHIYSHFRLAHQNQIAYFWLKKADLTRTGADSSDTEGLIDHIRAIAPVVVACVFEEVEPELTRVSLRSKSAKVNVSEIAAQFGGGGHSAAAGARILGKPLSVQRKVIGAVRRMLNSIH
ncbi:MAG: bifunctional oligoribonuclease/PAP phosphatase NrnA [Verrucomicrobia bacterium]|jgi:phosphoesterase RecJ-like protein|nr:bifunctional oligoribonuclease/PAP phosphatase NrnA [Verrucomicrobiota bacterium]OQC57075.1 MAG: Bifunctional oligoribonuclease and PAP phosphatase NrnA [Verrucomicrobia bacterium ADurb.Bin018]MBP8016042.1 bifunctional oligoribonuclease/PAP phosphatase NrnA [Verrucomicrobiota bacterium]HNW08579.1 bifunctional oligoribonuclease/PAP phosphatase NrnA [Verrucomicrobiota bacterium]HNZ76844.1 bifunctional oligoribonuclease/PAP phosphatase NrnA [Verrucomicrobiota bacterium]